MSPSMSPIAGVRSTSRGGASEPNTGAPGWTFGYSWVRTGWPPLKLWSGGPGGVGGRAAGESCGGVGEGGGAPPRAKGGPPRFGADRRGGAGGGRGAAPARHVAEVRIARLDPRCPLELPAVARSTRRRDRAADLHARALRHVQRREPVRRGDQRLWRGLSSRKPLPCHAPVLPLATET